MHTRQIRQNFLLPKFSPAKIFSCQNFTLYGTCGSVFTECTPVRHSPPYKYYELLLQPYHLKIFCGLTTYHQQPSHMVSMS